MVTLQPQFFRNSKTEYNYVDFLSIIATLLPLASRFRCRCRRLVVVIGVWFALVAYFCCHRPRILVVFVGISFSTSASRCRHYIAHGGGGFPPCGYFVRLRRLVNVVVVSVLSLLLANVL